MAFSSVTDRFDSLTRHMRAAVTPAHIMVAGDFNAKVGNLPDAWLSTFNEDIPARQSQDQGTNALGPHLMQLCEDTSMVLCTGRTPLDIPAAPSYPRGTRDLTTPWSVPASFHSSTAAASLPQLRIQTTAPLS